MSNDEFAKIVKTYSRLIFTISYRFIDDYQEAENITQETFLTAFKVIDGFVGDNYKYWLAKIATNKCKDYLGSARARHSEVAEDVFLESFHDGKCFYDELEHVDRLNYIKNECSKLGEIYYKIAVMYFIEEKSFSEIADILDMPLKTVQTRVYRAREKLRKQLLSKGAY